MVGDVRIRVECGISPRSLFVLHTRLVLVHRRVGLRDNDLGWSLPCVDRDYTTSHNLMCDVELCLLLLKLLDLFCLLTESLDFESEVLFKSLGDLGGLRLLAGKEAYSRLWSNKNKLAGALLKFTVLDGLLDLTSSQPLNPIGLLPGCLFPPPEATVGLLYLLHGGLNGGRLESSLFWIDELIGSLDQCLFE